MAKLKAFGFIRSIRGPKGGYVLAKAPEQIKLNDVFNCLEGPVVTVECTENENYCARAPECVARQVWTQVQEAVMAVLQSITFHDLVDRIKNNKSPDYQI